MNEDYTLPRTRASLSDVGEYHTLVTPFSKVLAPLEKIQLLYCKTCQQGDNARLDKEINNRQRKSNQACVRLQKYIWKNTNFEKDIKQPSTKPLCCPTISKVLNPGWDTSITTCTQSFSSALTSIIAQSAGAVEYTDCTSAEG